MVSSFTESRCAKSAVAAIAAAAAPTSSWPRLRCWLRGAAARLTGSSGFVTDGPGNYKYKTKCTWLIEGQPNRIMRLRFNHFATECSWDHLYVYDGDSIYAPLIAAFSGLIVPERDGNETVPEVVATSGYALLHFFSDAAYNLTGFNITYKNMQIDRTSAMPTIGPAGGWGRDSGWHIRG
ncbi:hypothetical protein QTO34_001934 [Cnephaeus nilssonii]|uniref:CUB domain-containing protein n=1 Tax=Cnephaeus nilssonii TaxID=3371016 RepID=A0AA40HTS2_CNENI|nr:hypothetical protein QTO34_001934 [Eptesicus nilssonii]